ncbi:hypothetical protein CDEF62S_05154 [Castellaniella defragrans]
MPAYPVQEGPEATIHIDATDKSVEIASGVQYQAWTFGGMVPGPVIHVRQGQTVNVVFTNHGTVRYQLIDFHAAMTPPSLHFVDMTRARPSSFLRGEGAGGLRLSLRHAAGAAAHGQRHVRRHRRSDPADPLPPADKSYVLVRGEWYTQQISGNVVGQDFGKMTPSSRMRSSSTNSNTRWPCPAVDQDKRVRLYMVSAGPSLEFLPRDRRHLRQGLPGWRRRACVERRLRLHGGRGQAPFDLVIPDAGHYAFVDHSMAHMALGAVGVLNVQAPGGAPAEKPQIEKAPAQPVAAAAAVPTAAAGPYVYDAKRGEALYTANCTACHQATGTGLPGAFPPLKGNPVVLDADATKHIRTVLNGLQGEPRDGRDLRQPHAGLRGDPEGRRRGRHRQSRTHFVGNQGKQVTADQVAKVPAPE